MMLPSTLTARAYAKINWSLSVLGQYENGYHELDMLMQSVALFDTLTFEKDAGISLWTSGGERISDASNLILQAANSLRRETGCNAGARITVDKRIPVMAGMGGGSADCAATMVALNKLWQTRLSREKMRELGMWLGADVPFCVEGGLMRVGGLGEKLSLLPSARIHELVLIQPVGGLSTRDVFREFDRANAYQASANIQGAVDALSQMDYAALNLCARNDLFDPAVYLLPAIRQARRDMKAAGARFAAMTGSGSVIFGAFDTEERAFRAQESLRGAYPFCLQTKTAPCGVEIME